MAERPFELPKGPVVVLARRAGDCPRCKGSIHPGDEIVKVGGLWLHVECQVAVAA